MGVITSIEYEVREADMEMPDEKREDAGTCVAHASDVRSAGKACLSSDHSLVVTGECTSTA